MSNIVKVLYRQNKQVLYSRSSIFYSSTNMFTSGLKKNGKIYNTGYVLKERQTTWQDEIV